MANMKVVFEFGPNRPKYELNGAIDEPAELGGGPMSDEKVEAVLDKLSEEDVMVLLAFWAGMLRNILCNIKAEMFGCKADGNIH